MDWIWEFLKTFKEAYNSRKVKKAVKKVASDLSNMSDEEFEAEINKYMDEVVPASSCESVKHQCYPDSCAGECQGMGWCDIATEFRNVIFPPFQNKEHPIGCECEKCKINKFSGE